ncbi:hypothetical protein ACTAQI_20160 [Pseudarthrobacter sp. alpha12b]
MITASFLMCLVLFVGFGVAIPWAIRADRADAHLAHRPGACPDGICDQP